MILVNVQDDRTKKLGAFTRFVPLSVPVGIGSLASYLIQKGHQVKLWDEAIQTLGTEDIKELVRNSQRPYVFGISCLTASISRGHKIAKQIKEIVPDAVIIFGGIHPTVLPEDTLNTGMVDFVIRKEGEVPLESLYRAIKNNENYESINGLSFKKNGKIIHNPANHGPYMDSLPPFPYPLFEKHIDKYDLGFVLGSRGCPYDCIFCSQRSITGRRFTHRSPEQVIFDIELLVNKYGQRLITFMDDNMLTDKLRVKGLCELIVKKGLHKKTTFQCQVRGDAVNEDILKSLKSANFITLDYGLETASERLMTIINKGETVKQNIEALKLSKKYGFRISGTFILGLPTETKEERFQCYQLAKRFLDHVRFNNATPYPGTKLYEIAKSENRLNVGKDWENLNACGTLVEGPFSRKSLAYVPIGTEELDLKTDILKYNLFFSCRWKVIAELLDRKKGNSGWFRMQSEGIFNREWIYLIGLGFRIVISWIGLFFFFFMLRIRHVMNFLRYKIQLSVRKEMK